jgi:hypothetical protein
MKSKTATSGNGRWHNYPKNKDFDGIITHKIKISKAFSFVRVLYTLIASPIRSLLSMVSSAERKTGVDVMIAFFLKT